MKASVTHAALSNVGGKVLLQDASLSLWGLQLHILLVEHWLQVSHFTLEPGDFLLHLDVSRKQALFNVKVTAYRSFHKIMFYIQVNVEACTLESL